MLLHEGGTVNGGCSVCLSILAAQQEAKKAKKAEKEGLDRLFNSGIIFPPPSGNQDGEKNEKPEEQEKKGSGGDSDTKKRREKESPDPSHQEKPEDADKPLEEGTAQPEADKERTEQSGPDTNSHEEKTKKPSTTPIYAACWSPDSYRPELFEQINKRWWSSDSRNSNLSATCWPTDSKSPEAMLLKSQLYQDPEKTRNNLISAKADEMLRQDPEYIKLEEVEKRLNDTPGIKFLENVLSEVGIGGNLVLDNITSKISSFNKQAIEMKKNELKNFHRNQAIHWCQETSWCQVINDYPIDPNKKNNLLVHSLAKELANNHIKKGEYVNNFGGSQETYSKPSCLLKPAKKILSSSITDSIIKIPLSLEFGKPGKILGHGIIYAKDKLVGKN